MIGLLLLDLDGTVRRTISGAKFINDPTDQEIIPEAARAIAHYVSQGYRVIGITNQAGVEHGYKSFSRCCIEQNNTMLLEKNIKRVYFCPDKDGKSCYGIEADHHIIPFPFHESYHDLICTFRKPGAGMLKVAIAQESPTSEIIYVGDRDEDYQAAQLAQVKFLWAKEWWTHGEKVLA